MNKSVKKSIEVSQEVQDYLDSIEVDKNSREYKSAFRNLLKSKFAEEWYESLEKGGRIYNSEISDFCDKLKDYGFSENYMRAILVPMILEDFGHVID